jgi:hypothetical protein
MIQPVSDNSTESQERKVHIHELPFKLKRKNENSLFAEVMVLYTESNKESSKNY